MVSGGTVMNRATPNHVLHFGSTSSSRLQRFGILIRSNRFALGGALLFAIIIPELLHPLVAKSYTMLEVLSPAEPGFYAAIAATLFAHLSLRKIGILPFVDEKVLVLPTFLLSFAPFVIFLQFGLRYFGLYHLLTAFGAGASWYYLLALLRARATAPRLAFVGEMALDEELLAAGIDWKHLGKPRMPRDVLGIVFDAEQAHAPAWERFFSRAVLRNIPIYELHQLREMMTGRVRLRTRPELVFGQLRPSEPYLRIKRAIDALFALLLLVPAVPIMAITVLLIRIESPGRAIFLQKRVGYQGRIFTCYKLRSMRSDRVGPAYTADNDPRITRVGRFIRKWRIDELPQLVNVLKGDMSLIGPRPEAVSLARSYQREIAHYAYRHAVRPGITGWAAVHQGNVALTDAATRKLEYDFYYIKYFSIWLDFLIVLMTIRTIVTGFGAK